MEQSQHNIDTFLLTLVAVIHSIFTVAIISFVVLTPFGYSFYLLNILIFLHVFAFIFFRRCVMTDIYDFFIEKSGLVENELPYMAKDNFVRDYIKSLIRGKKISKSKKKSFKHLRLDVIKNVKPFLNCKDEKYFKLIYNNKIQYIVINIIIVMMMIYKYNLQKLIPLLLAWVFTEFTLIGNLYELD
jgi:hypothetical protein